MWTSEIKNNSLCYGYKKKGLKLKGAFKYDIIMTKAIKYIFRKDLLNISNK